MHTKTSRRGGIYLVVLATVMLVALLGTAGVLAQTRQRQRARGTMDSARAATMAQAAIELGLQRIESDDYWRNNIGGGVWYNQVAPTGDPNDGVLSLAVGAPGGGALSTGSEDPYELVALGEFGNARRQVSLAVNLVNTASALECLDAVIYADNDIVLNNSASVLGNGIIATNANIYATSSQVFLDAEAFGLISGAAYHGTTTTGTPARTVPLSEDLEPLYWPQATAIDIESLPNNKGDYFLSDVALGPGHNPFGAGETNPDGIYLIDCGNNVLYIENLRVVGTLIIVQPRGSKSQLRGSISLQPAVAGYPALIIQHQKMAFAMTNTPLSESTRGVNFNPDGVPDRGSEDADLADSYPSRIEGIVFMDKEAVLVSGSYTTIRGHLLTNAGMDFEIGSNLLMEEWTEARENPPPGFVQPGGTTELVMGPWVRDLD
ncbi:MAG: hypothetical protein DHS20C14_08660 [Phycisphaeraceae bacterium]|nr:MAG: hypothetical protein DHS20C14_08660 [Phycisphaeraceae bacterium]